MTGPGAGAGAFEVRRAREGELDDVARLTVATYVDDGFIDASDDYVERLADTPRRAREAEIWVAVTADGLILGAVTFCPLGSRLREIARAGEGEFRMLAVSVAARGRGVGRALVERCLERCREEGYTGCRMSSMDVMASAHRVYERLGFARAPHDDWSPAPGTRLLAYELSLAAPAGP